MVGDAGWSAEETETLRLVGRGCWRGEEERVEETETSTLEGRGCWRRENEGVEETETLRLDGRGCWRRENEGDFWATWGRRRPDGRRRR